MAWKFEKLVNKTARVGFGQDIVFTPSGGDPIPLVAIFDAAYRAVDLQGEAAVAPVIPTIDVDLEVLGVYRPTRDDHVSVPGVGSFRVDRVHDTGRAALLVYLKRVG